GILTAGCAQHGGNQHQGSTEHGEPIPGRAELFDPHKSRFVASRANPGQPAGRGTHVGTPTQVGTTPAIPNRSPLLPASLRRQESASSEIRALSETSPHRRRDEI